MISTLITVVAGAAVMAVTGAVAVNLVDVRRQRQQAHMWRVVRLYTPSGLTVRPDGLEALLTGLWGKLRRSALSALLYGQPRAACEMRADDTGCFWAWVVPADEVSFLRQLLASCLPGVEHDEVPEYLTTAPPDGHAVATTEILLQRHAAYPIAEFTPRFSRTLAGVLEANRRQGTVTVQVLLRPVRDAQWKPAARAELLKAEGKDPGAAGSDVFGRVNAVIGALFDAVNGAATSSGTTRPAAPKPSRLERTATKDTPAKLLKPGFDVRLRIMTTAPDRREAQAMAARVAALFHTLDGTNHFRARSHGWPTRPETVWRSWARRVGPAQPGGLILTPDELASMICPAVAPESGDNSVRVIELRTPPLADGIHVCDGQYRGMRVAVRIAPADLDTHLALQGKTGNGKGVLQEHLFREIARLGMGAIYLDPLGGSVRKLLASLPENRLDDVVYIEAGNSRWAHPLNFLAGIDGDPETTAADAVNLYYRLWADAWGKSTEETLRAATIAVIQAGGALPEVELVISSPEYRQSILPRVTSAPIRQFLQTLPDKVTESLRPPLNKLHELLWQDSILAMVGQADSLDWRQMIKDRRLILVNLNKGSARIGPMGASLISGIVWSRVGRAGLSIPVSERTRFVQVADEIKDVAGRTPEDFETAFSQYRQFLLPVVAAGQYPAQLPEKVWGAMTGNVGSKLVLREDQPHSAECIKFVGGAGILEDRDLNNLPQLTGFANLTINKRPTGVFTCWAPPFSQQLRDPDEAAEYSFKRWAKSRNEVLAAINQRILTATRGRGARPLD